MMIGDITLIVVLLLILIGSLGIVLLIVFWLKSSYRQKDLKIKELQKEIEELKSKK
ncbi:DUF1049 domain-containing protein [Evansella cellulosilytica]|uniref:DUF4083 domain-containing protein n=1 Tax=Evansella cellulosilytica (strain ATCC 21833 / DSM 2522 / FERM P-1141 / JCM 9156 / N-4) TaxID=649639 RepID=E6TVQ3_EVAC2|nr:DUF1049 domain-containing protein [Evansella cellulosilytica]ADU32181.1 hypothetical protein Bcell_3947 [Evansella cellulosilytica DSM 2522]